MKLSEYKELKTSDTLLADARQAFRALGDELVKTPGIKECFEDEGSWRGHVAPRRDDDEEIAGMDAAIKKHDFNLFIHNALEAIILARFFDDIPQPDREIIGGWGVAPLSANPLWELLHYDQLCFRANEKPHPTVTKFVADHKKEIREAADLAVAKQFFLERRQKQNQSGTEMDNVEFLEEELKALQQGQREGHDIAPVQIEWMKDKITQRIALEEKIWQKALVDGKALMDKAMVSGKNPPFKDSRLRS